MTHVDRKSLASSIPKPALVEILRNRFQGIVDEMGSVVLRTGHTVFVKETGDFGTALVSPNSELFAAPLHYGVCIMAGMPSAVAFDAVSESAKPGAVFIANDPYTTGGMSTHLNDVFLWKPVFVGNELVCYSLSFIHSTDVGGGVPGSISNAHREIYQEGLRIPPTLIGDARGWDEKILGLILANSRIPALTRGDLNALLAAINVGEQRVTAVADRFGVEVLKDGIEGVLEYGARKASVLIDAIPDGTYEFADYMDESRRGGMPVRISLKLVVEGDRVLLDYTDTDPQADSAINMPTEGQNGHHFLVRGIVNYLRTQDPDGVPYQSGLIRQIDTKVASGSLLHPSFGAACGVRAATNIRLMEVILGALAQAVPDRIPAAGAGQAAVVLVAVPSPEQAGDLQVSVVEPLCGGSGGRPSEDGIDGTDSLTGGLRNIPIETLESEMPILIERYGLREGSAGAGQFRGGHGVDLVFRTLSHEAIVTARNIDRYRFRPWGREGAQPGSLGHAQILRHGGRTEEIGRPDIHTLRQDDVVSLASQGGGGYGDPLNRDVALLQRDLDNDLIDPDSARSKYGVVVIDGRVDVAGTAALRSGLRAHRSSTGQFAFGPEREHHEATFAPRLRDQAVHRVRSLPSAQRRAAWTAIESLVTIRSAAREHVTEADIMDAIHGQHRAAPSDR